MDSKLEIETNPEIKNQKSKSLKIQYIIISLIILSFIFGVAKSVIANNQIKPAIVEETTNEFVKTLYSIINPLPQIESRLILGDAVPRVGALEIEVASPTDSSQSIMIRKIQERLAELMLFTVQQSQQQIIANQKLSNANYSTEKP
jgi:hypothetical protein